MAGRDKGRRSRKKWGKLPTPPPGGSVPLQGLKDPPVSVEKWGHRKAGETGAEESTGKVQHAVQEQHPPAEDSSTGVGSMYRWGNYLVGGVWREAVEAAPYSHRNVEPLPPVLKVLQE